MPTKKYRAAHREEANANTHAYRARKYGSGGSYSNEEWQILLASCENKCVCCGLECKPEADHVVPIAKGGTSNINNIQPLCRSCNASKGTKIIDYRMKINTTTI